MPSNLERGGIFPRDIRGRRRRRGDCIGRCDRAAPPCPRPIRVRPSSHTCGSAMSAGPSPTMLRLVLVEDPVRGDPVEFHHVTKDVGRQGDRDATKCSTGDMPPRIMDPDDRLYAFLAPHHLRWWRRVPPARGLLVVAKQPTKDARGGVKNGEGGGRAGSRRGRRGR